MTQHKTLFFQTMRVERLLLGLAPSVYFSVQIENQGGRVLTMQKHSRQQSLKAHRSDPWMQYKRIQNHRDSTSWNMKCKIKSHLSACTYSILNLTLCPCTQNMLCNENHIYCTWKFLFKAGKFFALKSFKPK